MNNNFGLINHNYNKLIHNLMPTMISLLVFSVSLFSSCGHDQYYQADVFLNSIADTISLGDSRQVFISDGVGGFYFDDAFGASNRSEYGYSRGERKILSGWNIFDGYGKMLDVSPEYTVIHPTKIQYQFANDLIATVQMPVNFPGLIITVRANNNSGIIIRPQFDMRRLDREETPNYINSWDPNQKLLLVARSDSLGGWTTISTKENILYRSYSEKQRMTHDQSYNIGSPEESMSWSSGEFQLESGLELTLIVSWGETRRLAIENIAKLKADLVNISTKRQQWAISVLEPIQVKCNDLNFIKAFAWARLVATQLIAENDNSKYLWTGIPFQPYTHGFYTCLSLPGLQNTGLPVNDALSVLENLISTQNQNELSDRYGMIPGSVTENGPQYKIPEIAGMIVIALKQINYRQPLDSTTHVKFGKILYQSLVGTARYRLYNGLVSSNADEYLLWDSPLAPDRSGATIESQVLFIKLQNYILRHPFSDAIDPEMPTTLVYGAGTFRERLYKGDLIATSKSGDFIIPIVPKQMIGSFNKTVKRKFQRIDQIKFVGIQELDVKQDLEKYASSEISRIIAMYLNDQGKQLPDIFAMEQLMKKELMGASGFRSRSPQADNYNPEHVYLLENAPAGTKTSGDVLIWTSCIMADILRRNAWGNTNNWLRIDQLLKELNRRILTQGVTGGITEAEDSEPISGAPQAVGNSIFLASNAEYLRLVTENIFGILRAKGIYLALRPNFPKNWGETELQLQLKTGSVTLKRITEQHYYVTQTGVEPYLELSFESILESNSRVFTTARIYPDEEIQIHLDRGKNGNLIGRVVREKRWQ